jgi:hypothetical protein
MKKLFLAAALGVVAMFSMAQVASANIISPGVGGAVTANGSISLRGAILNTVCNLTLNGRVVSTTNVLVTGGSGNCNTGTLILSDFNWLKTITLAGAWNLAGLAAGTGIRAQVNVPLLSRPCIYRGSIGGTWSSDGFDTILTILGGSTALVLDRVNSDSLCSATPTVTGTITLLDVVTV